METFLGHPSEQSEPPYKGLVMQTRLLFFAPRTEAQQKQDLGKWETPWDML